MDYKSIIIKPKSFSTLVSTYFTVFIKNFNVLFIFNLIVLVLFYLLIGNVEENEFSDDYLNSQLIKTVTYICFFSIPASFISSFFLTLINNVKPNFKNIINTFSGNFISIFLSNFLLCTVIFLFSLIIKSQFLMFQFSGPINYILVEILYCILCFYATLLAYCFNPYRPSIKNSFTKNTFKYLVTIFVLLLISIGLYRLSFNILITIIDLFTEIIGINNPDFIYNNGLIIIEYINKIAIFTILIYIYYNFTAETKNAFHLEEINQIKLSEDETDNF